ncbi:MAG: PAS domain S-box protein [Melioribacteraceae bacterium]|nr:PAS domain S-box protein [Melioribacteraceae bacterium]
MKKQTDTSNQRKKITGGKLKDDSKRKNKIKKSLSVKISRAFPKSPVIISSKRKPQTVLNNKNDSEKNMGLEFIDKKCRKMIGFFNDAVLIVNDKAVCVEVNKAACKLTGYSKTELIGKSIKDISPKRNQKVFKTVWQTFMEKGILSGEFVLVRKDQKEILVDFNAVANFVPGFHLSILRDITEKKQREVELINSETRWKYALEGAGDGLWDWDAQSNKVFFSIRWKSMLGYEEHEISDSLDEWSSRIHPDDKEKSLGVIESYLKGETTSYQSEHRLRCKDGLYKWILDRGKIVEWTDDGKPLRVIGTHTDIDFQKKTIEELENKNIFIQTILDNLPIGLATNEFDSGRANYINNKFREIYGWPKEIINDVSSFFKHLYPDPQYRQEIASKIMEDIQSGDPARMKWDNVKITTEKGEERYVSAVNIPIMEQNIMVSTVRDVTERKMYHDKIIQHNKKLTELLNISNLLTSTLDLNTILQTITDRVINLIDLDSGFLYLIDGEHLYLSATTPPLDPNFPDIFRHAILSDHSLISKTVTSGQPLFVYDTREVELSPAEQKVIETRHFRSLLYLPLSTGNGIIAVMIVGTVDNPRLLSESEIEICRTLSNISALAIANAKLYRNSQQDIENLKVEMNERIRIEEALRASEDKFSKAFRINPDAININRLSDGLFVEVNGGFTRLTGYTYDEVVGKTSYEINIWADLNDRNRLAEGLKTRAEVIDLEAQFRLKDGSIKTGLMSASLIDINNEKFIISITRDITERKKAEELIRQKSEELNNYFSNALDLFCIADTDGYLIKLNKQWENVLGYRLDEIEGKRFSDFVHPDDMQLTLEIISKLSEHQQVLEFINRFRAKSGENKVIEWRSYLSGKRIYAAARDVTEKFNAEKELKENQRRLAETNQLLQSVLDTVPSRLFWKDKNLTYLGCNKLFANDAGRSSPAELIGLNDYEMSWKDQTELYRADDTEVIETGIAKINYEETQTTPDGKQIWLRTSKVPLRDIDQKIIGVLGNYEDITSKKITEEALKESEERYKALFNNNHSVMLLIDPDTGAIVDANPAACNYYGWVHNEMLNKKITEINTLSGEEIFKEMELARIEKRNRFFFKHRLANGEIRDVEVFSGSVVINSKILLYSIIHDITEQKAAERALIDSEEKYRYMFAKNPQPMWIYELCTLKFIEVNDAAVNHYGYSRDEFLSMTLKDIRPPEDIPALLEDIELTHNVLNSAGEWRHVRKDGTLINVEIVSHSVSFYGKPARHVLIKDITERIQFEKQITEALKEKDILIREVHHRVKNNFQVIISLLSLQSDLITDPLILNAFKESRNRIKSMALIHELLYQESNFESIDIKHYVQNLVDYLRRSYSDTKSNFNISIDMEDIQIEIDTIIPCGLIINELISNSIKHAFPDGRDGEILISFKKISTESFCLILRDNGIGIPNNIDFSSLKSLGMMLINTLTKQINGELYIDSTEKGSEFRIIFKAKH